LVLTEQEAGMNILIFVSSNVLFAPRIGLPRFRTALSDF